MIPCWLSYLNAVARPPRDPLRELAEIPSSIVSSGLHLDDGSCARSGGGIIFIRLPPSVLDLRLVS